MQTHFPHNVSLYSSFHLPAPPELQVATSPSFRAVSQSFSPSHTSTLSAVSTSGRRYSTRRVPLTFHFHLPCPSSRRCRKDFGSRRTTSKSNSPFSSK